ncbi:PfkB family carbohydrate kinase [Cyanobium sp. CH-040]|uniref:PfkB family carbohydrate kinase n=1 Tax=Cyanobium sp. CH-040 TaxID=2823708 RepID=UPI0020CFBF00|nr:PfkB family carbohydrate kinase [Cyanobium sp. CH-040]MCP9926997.1 ribokinase [Cyanobium sp. CH-040]
MAARLDPLPLEQLPALPALRLAVVGHVEVVTFLALESLPRAGLVQTARACLDLPGGAGAVAAVQLARLTGVPVRFHTALGRDAVGERAAQVLSELGLDLQVAWRDAPTRRGVSLGDRSGERSIVVIGERLSPRADDPLPWHELARCDGVFATAADVAALRQARAARVLTATPRLPLPVLQEAGVALDALIGSGLDPAERVPPGALRPAPVLRIATAGAQGGMAEPLGAFAAPPRARPVVDSYGAGDCFAAGVTAGLAAGWSAHQAISLGCHCGSACLDGLGPYAGQLRRGAGGWSQEPLG